MKSNKIALVTGSTSDIGFELCRILLAHGYELVNIDRNKQGAIKVKEQLLTEFPKGMINNYTADLSDFQRVKITTHAIIDKYNQIDLLFLNAGVLLNEKTFNKDQIEQHLATNSLAPYFLTLSLMPVLKQSKKAKIVVSGSGISRMVKNIEVSQLVNPTNFKPMSGAYAQSKATVKVLFSYLQEQYRDIDFSVVELPPTKTKMATSEAMPTLLKWFLFLFSSAEKSANKLYQATIVHKGIKTEKKHDEITEQLISLAGKYYHEN